MIFKPGSLIEIINITSGLYIAEKNDIITTKNVFIEKGYYVVLESIGDERNIYIEILYKGLVALVFYKPKLCRIIEQ